MIILSHRGYWQSPEEKNTLEAFEKSFSLGFGTETDLRDFKGELVISHDIATESSLSFASFLEVYKDIDDSLPLALNIKADGLQKKLKDLLDRYHIKNYFLFDMSVPDGVVCLDYGLDVFTRQSEYEKTLSFYDQAIGVWMDEFIGHWVTNEIIQGHLLHEKSVCIVSPELHGRPFEKEWLQYRNFDCQFESKQSLMLCTDFPEKARSFFEKD